MSLILREIDLFLTEFRIFILYKSLVAKNNEFMDEPLKLNTDIGNILDKEHTYKHVMQTMLPGLIAEQVYEMTGAQLATLIHDATYFAHSNGRTRERKISSTFSHFVR